MHRTAIHADYFKKIKVTNVALSDVAFFTLNNYVFFVKCVNTSSFMTVGKLQFPFTTFQESLKPEQHFVYIS